ncbi:MAG: hypothetical protein HY689_15760 [Chloroflexi bacterium]|nr:hypothetical protein [Chloroflexota bacterium]
MLVLVALVMVVLLAMIGLAIDTGLLFIHRRQVQAAADAAARAALVHLYPAARNETKAQQVALDYAGQNGLTHNGDDITVAVSIPPQAGPRAGDPDYVEVTVTRRFPTVFLTIISHDWAEVSARAVAGVQPEASDIAFLALSPTACYAVRLSADAQLTVNGGRFVVNSSCSEALRVDNTAALTASSIEVVGGYRKDSGATISPTPQTGADAVPDPLQNLAAPAFAGLTVRSGSATNPRTLELSSGTTTLSPGIYYGGLRIQGTATVTFQPGTYILAGGGLEVRDTATVTGNGVFLYNTRDPASPSGDGAFRRIKMDVESPGKVALSAPTSGDYAGVVIFQDRANTERFEIEGALNTLAGTIYLPSATAEARVEGGAHTAQIIARQFEMTASDSTLTVNFDGSQAYKQPQGSFSE